ncbi:MAG: RluA family pseudouridine synthase [Candidatus Liptonbacteria bacterium]|nr:RluA family pseudouridine synthase [Candidatus Liptonbacteria bacterium]
MKNREKFEPEVIYEDRNFLAVNKPAGLLVHASNLKLKNKNEKLLEPTLVSWLLYRYKEISKVGDDPKVRPGIVHRLDKDTSGVMLIARNQKYFDYLKKLFQEHKIRKTYLALVYGIPKEKKGVINKPIALKPGTTKRSVFGGKMEKEAVTEYNLVEGFNETSDKVFSLLEVHPRTGRTHQIRVHLASIGCPVLNDQIYAPKKEKVGSGRLMLHALSLEFTNETGKKILIESELPKEFREVTDN